MRKSLAITAVLGTGLTCLGTVLPLSSASAADAVCGPDSAKLIQTIPAVTHTESQWSKTVDVPAVGDPTIPNPDYKPAYDERVFVPATWKTIHHDAVTKVVHHPEQSHTEWQVKPDGYAFAQQNHPDHVQYHEEDWNPGGGWNRVPALDQKELVTVVDHEAWDETVTVKAAWDEKVVDVPAHWTTVHHDAVGDETIPNPDYVPATTQTVYYNGKPAGTTNQADAAWVKYVPAGWPDRVDTRVVTDTPASYVCDFEKPVTTLLNGATPVQPGYVFNLSSTDNDAVAKTVGNIYAGGALLKSHQAAGSTLGVPAPSDGAYTLRYNSADKVGNIASTGSFDFISDGTAPQVTAQVDGGASDGPAQSLGFNFTDPTVNGVESGIAGVRINGVDTPLAVNKWSNLDTIKPGWYGAVEGTNTLVAYDKAGNESAPVTFTLDTTGPVITDKGTDGAPAQSKSFSLADANAQVDYVLVNGQKWDLANNKWSDANGIAPGKYFGVEGDNTIQAFDTLGNASPVEHFTLDTTGPVITEKPDSSAASRSFSLDDGALGAKVAGVRINGKDFPLAANRWSDVNDVVDGNYWGATAGDNTLVAYDALGNETTVTFTLDPATPTTSDPTTDPTTPGSDTGAAGGSDDTSNPPSDVPVSTDQPTGHHTAAHHEHSTGTPRHKGAHKTSHKTGHKTSHKTSHAADPAAPAHQPRHRAANQSGDRKGSSKGAHKGGHKSSQAGSTTYAAAATAPQEQIRPVAAVTSQSDENTLPFLGAGVGALVLGAGALIGIGRRRA